ncbi:hypothetical protein [Paenibacillus sp. MMS18-CY102]|uniref:hypothetical protein n=1 Tax=Paenibacillus sp. MMS18-CY102 TaxID=2682849 RepID=UPI001365FAFD|nr:hypothetical protein [Paenibacillus sp. MMS18-CY102]MWC27727.1 hypothetical protein [Paenibacillus sp. MMS18-CY102]
MSASFNSLSRKTRKGTASDMIAIVIVLAVIAVIAYVSGILKPESGGGNILPSDGQTVGQIVNLANLGIEESTHRHITKLHKQFNAHLGYGEWEKLDGEGWDAMAKEGLLDPMVYLKLGDELAKLEGAEDDMTTLAILAKHASDHQDVQSILYMHRILQDFDYWILADEPSDGEYWGVTQTYPNYSLKPLTQDAKEIIAFTKSK